MFSLFDINPNIEYIANSRSKVSDKNDGNITVIFTKSLK